LKRNFNLSVELQRLKPQMRSSGMMKLPRDREQCKRTTTSVQMETTSWRWQASTADWHWNTCTALCNCKTTHHVYLLAWHHNVSLGCTW